jgi:hypothetical protein
VLKISERLNTKLTKILENYKRPNILSYIATFVLPITGPMVEGYKWLLPGQTPFWLSMTGIFLISYTIVFVISAVMVKRALMLGGEERSAYFPGALASNQYYDKEKQILSSIGIKKTEFPLDALLFFINITIAYLSLSTQFQFYERIGLQVPPQNTKNNLIILIEFAVFILIAVLAIYRRKINGRE